VVGLLGGQATLELGPDAEASLSDLNRSFTAWLHQQYHRTVHSETGATPAGRYHAEGRDRPAQPDPVLLRRAFLWREQRTVTAFATVSHTCRGNTAPSRGKITELPHPAGHSGGAAPVAGCQPVVETVTVVVAWASAEIVKVPRAWAGTVTAIRNSPKCPAGTARPSSTRVGNAAPVA
jgi:hypothetical protein